MTHDLIVFTDNCLTVIHYTERYRNLCDRNDKKKPRVGGEENDRLQAHDEGIACIIDHTAATIIVVLLFVKEG
jgi:hypothetical protein